MGAGLRLGWLNALTADVSLTQALQGQGVTGTQPVPGLAQSPRRDTQFFFILGARL